jgi:hypothetical protein
MAKQEVFNLSPPAGNASGPDIYASDLSRWTVIVSGTFTANVQIQVSNDPGRTPADASYVNFQTALAAPGLVQSLAPVRWIRAKVSGYAAGTPVAFVAGSTADYGHDQRSI